MSDTSTVENRGGTTIIERGEAGEPARVIMREGEPLPGIKKDQSRIPHEPYRHDADHTIRLMRVLDSDDLDTLHRSRVVCASGEGIRNVVQSIEDRARARGDSRMPAQPHDICEVVNQTVARLGQADSLAEAILPGRAKEVREGLFEAGLRNQPQWHAAGRRGPLTCPMAFDEAFQRAQETLQAAQRDGVVDAQEYEALTVLRLPQDDGSHVPLDVTTLTENDISAAQQDCYKLEDASPLDGTVSGWVRGLEIPPQQVSSLPEPPRRTARR